jgi:hypothetical protein
MTRNELLNIVRGQCHGCGRAIDDPRSSIEVYGLFSDMRGSEPAWILEVRHRLGKRWIWCVIPSGIRSYSVIPLDSVSWSKWIGDTSSGLNMGDNPNEYKELRNAMAN